MQEIERAVQQEVEDGDLDEMEAQFAVQQRQQELIVETAESVERRLADDDGVAVADSVTEIGALLVAGSPTALVDLLETDHVSALLTAQRFHDLQEQRAQQDG